MNYIDKLWEKHNNGNYLNEYDAKTNFKQAITEALEKQKLDLNAKLCKNSTSTQYLCLGWSTVSKIFLDYKLEESK